MQEEKTMICFQMNMYILHKITMIRTQTYCYNICSYQCLLNKCTQYNKSQHNKELKTKQQQLSFNIEENNKML